MLRYIFQSKGAAPLDARPDFRLNPMDATLRALGELIIQALPTFFIVLLLHFYLKQVFFKPLARILAERNEATEGARSKAAVAHELAAAKAAAYEEQIRAARNEIYREQEQQRRQWREQQTSQINDARKRAEALVTQARTQIASEAAQARQALANDTQLLADRITRSLLQGRAA
jgi:F-type H+-transporting ATPase subunit b